jgi:hypothetical protein
MPEPDLDLNSYSGFIEAHLKPGRVSAFLRLDRNAEPCPDCPGIDYLPVSSDSPFTMTLAGAEYFLLPSVRFSPNVDWVHDGTREKQGPSTLEDDFVCRANVFWIG